MIRNNRFTIWFGKIKWEVAMHSLLILLLAVGCIAAFCFIFTLRWFWIPPAILFFLIAWYLIYRAEIAAREVRLQRGWFLT